MSIRRSAVVAAVTSAVAVAVAAVVVVVAAAIAMLAVAPPAEAELDAPNPLGCAASASVQGGRGKSQFVDATDGEVRLPRQGDVYWSASVAQPAHQESGAVRVRLGFWSVTVGRWGRSENATNQVMRQGATMLPAFVRYVPPGRYRVEGVHEAAEGRCSGAVTVVLAGSGVTTLGSVAATALAVALALGLARAGRRRLGRARGRPVKGAVMGAFLGATLAGVLLSTYLIPSDSLLVGGLPILLLLVGVALGALAPFGRAENAEA